jgi:hypothetical protein
MPSACTRGDSDAGAGGRRGPRFHRALLATAVAGLPPRRGEFVAVVTWDGLRACIAVAGGRVRAWSRGGRDIIAAYPELGVLAAAATRRTLVLTRRPARRLTPSRQLRQSHFLMAMDSQERPRRHQLPRA